MFYKMAYNDDRPKRESKTKFIGPFISVHFKLYSKIIARLQYRDCNTRLRKDNKILLTMRYLCYLAKGGRFW